MDRPEYYTDEMRGYLDGLKDAADIYNAGHLSANLAIAMLIEHFVPLSLEDAVDIYNEWTHERN